MTPSQVDLVQSSFLKVAPGAEAFAELFLGRLLFLDPSLTPLFRGDRKQQDRMMMDTLRLAVVNLGSLDRIMSGLRALGIRHKVYGVRAEDYDTVREALLWSLHEKLRDQFTPQVRQSWASAYELLICAIQDVSLARAA